MLFRKKITRSCSYCEFSTKLDEERMLCSKKGITAVYNACRKFKYDPCKRVPFHALEREMATHSSVLAWRIPGSGEPGGLPSLCRGCWGSTRRR